MRSRGRLLATRGKPNPKATTAGASATPASGPGPDGLHSMPIATAAENYTTTSAIP